MNNAKSLGLLAIVLLGVASSQCAWAEVDPAGDAMDLYYQVTHSFIADAKRAGMLLLFGLLGLQITINGIKKLMSPSEIDGLVGAVVWPITSAAFYAALIQFSDTMLPKLVGSFEYLGKQAGSGMELSPGEFVFHGIDVAMQMQTAFQQAIGGGTITFLLNIFPALFLLFIQIVVVLSFAVLGLQMALALINAYFYFAITPILLGFGGLSFTRDMALSALKGGIAVGMKMMVIYFIAAVALRMAPLWGELIGTISLTNFRPFWVVGTSVALFAYLANQVPKLAADLLNGTASLTAGDAASNSMMGMAAMATAGAGMVGAAQAAKQAGASATETLGKLVHGGSPGLDAGGATGGGRGGAIAQASGGGGDRGGITGGSVRNMLDTSPSQTRASGGSDALGGGTSRGAGRGGDASSSPAGGQAGGGSSGQTGAASNSLGSDFGDASDARFGGGASGNGNISNDELAKQLQQFAASMGNQNQPSTADKIRNLASYVPNDQASVGVNAQLGGSGGGHE